jgi:integrase
MAKFHSTAVTNLLRSDRGVYYSRIVHRGRQHWKSLKTSVLAVARQRLRVQEDLVRGRRTSTGGPKTFGDAAAIYAYEVNRELRLAASTKEFRLRPQGTFQRTWPELWTTDLRRITTEHCLDWQRSFENGGARYTPHNANSSVAGNSSTVVNACIGYLRRVFGVAVREGVILQNPAMAMPRMVPNWKQLRLPSSEQFKAIVAHVRRSPSRWRDHSADFIEGLAYSGMRKAEAGRLTWEDIDLDRGLMIVKGTKTRSSNRTVPLTPAMRELLLRLERTGPEVFIAKDALISLTKACEAINAPRINQHGLRHLFATVCIESGVDIPTLSRWLGHADGGTLAMKTYGHLRSIHSTEAAAKVRF